MSKKVLFEINDDGNSFSFASTIESELSKSKIELDSITENMNSIKLLKAECDKIDYCLSITSGALCGIIDIFLVRKPGESIIGDITDTGFDSIVRDFAKKCGWNDGRQKPTSSAIRFLEKRFNIPYDQRGAGDAGQSIFNLNPKNHHFKSLAHNPSLLGLFFSILDQFRNESHFISNGELISLQQADDRFELKGSNILSKLFCAIVNWIGHLISDISGSSGSKGRGMGIPSPLWTWANDVIAIKRAQGFSSSRFDKSMNELAIKMFNEGYDIRFQTVQLVPVVLNEMIVRFFYSIRRMIKYFSHPLQGNRTFLAMWQECEPFSNPTVKRMLTTSHGTFCLVDASDALINGVRMGNGGFNTVESIMRLNVIGVGRLTISLYGEVKREAAYMSNKQFLYDSNREKENLRFYIEGLKKLNEIYDDGDLLRLIKDFSNSDVCKQSFYASVKLAEKRRVPKESILYTKQAGDSYFQGGQQ